MSNAIVAAERFLYGELAANAALTAIVNGRIKGHVVPPGVVPPYVFFTMQAAGDDVSAVAANRIFSHLVYTVRVVDKTESFVSLEAGAAAIEAALHREFGSNVSGEVLACIQERPFSMVELDRDGAELRHLGATFRIYVQ